MTSSRSRNRSLGRWLTAAAAAGALASASLVAVSPAYAAATTYYVDAVSGSDAASGTTPSSAWRTLSAVNSRTFGAGDRILLARGQSWSGQLAPRGSGTASAPITISAYGTGTAPHIDGATVATGGAIHLQNQSHWTIEKMLVTSDSGADNFGSLTTDGTPRSGIQVRNTVANSTNSGIIIRDNEVRDVNGCFHCVGIDAHVNGGIVVDTAAMGANFNGVLVEGNHVEDVGRTGITVWDASYFTTSMTVVVQSALSKNVIIRGNTVIDPDSDGILAFGTDGAVLEYNVVRGAGQRTIVGSTMSASAGLWPTRAMNTLIQFNEVSGTLLHGTDGQGFDVDLGSTNTIVQHNYSHGNEGGFILLMGGYSSDVTVRYNLSVNDGWGGDKGVFTFSWGVPGPVRIYNNTVIVPSGSPAKIIYCDGDAGACAPSTPGTWTFVNNIIDNQGTGGYSYPGLGTNATFSSNVFTGNHPASEPADASKITTGPGFVAPGTTGDGFAIADAYRLAPGSAAISSGAVVSANGGRDFFDNAVSTTAAPSRGFHEAATHTAPSGIVDPADDWSLTIGRSTNMQLDTTGPLSNMAGDTSRFKRSNSAAGWVRWPASSGEVLVLETYMFGQTPAAITVVARDALGAETTVAKTATAAAATTNGWVRHTVTSSPMPAGTVSVDLRISAVTAYAVQLGHVQIG